MNCKKLFVVRSFMLSLVLLCAATALSARSRPAVADTAELAKNLVTLVKGKNTLGAGIAFSVRPDALFIATAYHVVAKGVEWIEFRFLSGAHLQATLIRSDKGLDLAVLRVETPQIWLQAQVSESLKFQELGYVGAIRKGDPVYPIGHPGGENWYVPTVPPAVYKVIEERIVLDYGCSPGHSGGAVFDEHWHLAGMIRKTGQKTCDALSFKRIVKTLADEWGFSVDLPERSASAPAAQTKAGVRQEAYSSGSACMIPGSAFDLDTGKWNSSQGNDIYYNNIDGIERDVRPSGGAELVFIGRENYDSLSRDKIAGMPFSSEPIDASKTAANRLIAGAIFGVRTSEDRYAKVRVERPGDYLEFTWQTFAKEGETPLPVVSPVSGPCRIEQEKGCDTGKLPGDEIRHFRVIYKAGNEITIDVDYTFNPAHGNQIYFGALLLDANGEALSTGFRPAAAPTPGSGTVQLNVAVDPRLRRPSQELFIWMYEPYKAEGFACRRFPYQVHW